MSIFSCRDASRLVSAAMDRPLSFRERLSLNSHLMMCSLCQRFQNQMHRLRHVARLSDRDACDDGVVPDVTLSPEARERISRSL